jgi:hypothetical protein
MLSRSRRRIAPGAAWAAALLLPLLGGCANGPGPARWSPAVPSWLPAAVARPSSPPRYDYFARPRAGDPWSIAIGSWRRRERTAHRVGRVAPFPTPLPSVSSAPSARGGAPEDYALARHYDAFLSERREHLARDVLRWVQGLARERFVEDGPVDHWPTMAELLGSVGDDCDGLELLAYHALRQLGFPADRVYRAVLHRPDTGQHHMVTLWFDRRDDPWMLDPTDTITSRLRRMSTLPRWVPLKVFSEDAEFTVTRLDPPAPDAARAGVPEALHEARGSE